MEVKIYVDVLFIINFIIDYILLSVTSFFAKKSPGILRMCSGATIGALFSATMFFISLNTFFSLLITAVVAFLMVMVSFGAKKASAVMKNTAIFYLVSVSSSGLAFATIFFKKSSNIAVNNGIFYADIDAYTMLFVFVLSVTVIHVATGYVKKQNIKSAYLYNVTIEKNGKIANDTALFDSGNFTREPISQKSVIIAEWHTVSCLFDENEITKAIVNNPKDFVYIGCNSFGGAKGMYAFSPDKVTSEEIEFQEPVLVAITDMLLDKDGCFHMLLPNDVKLQTF